MEGEPKTPVITYDVNHTSPGRIPHAEVFFGNFWSYICLQDVICLIYPDDTADSILNGNSYDKAIRAHLLIDAAIVQHVIPPNTFTGDELKTMEHLVNNAKSQQGYNPYILSISFESIDEIFFEYGRSQNGRKIYPKTKNRMDYMYSPLLILFAKLYILFKKITCVSAYK